MEFVRSNFFPNETLSSCPLFFTHFWFGFGFGFTKHCSMSFLYSSTRNMLQCFVKPKPNQKWVKKGATGQSFIRKEITCYRIGTLATIVTYFLQSSPQKKLFYQHEGEKLAKKIVLTSMIVFKKDSNDKSENIIGGWAIIGISSIDVSPV